MPVVPLNVAQVEVLNAEAYQEDGKFPGEFLSYRNVGEMKNPSRWRYDGHESHRVARMTETPNDG